MALLPASVPLNIRTAATAPSSRIVAEHAPDDARQMLAEPLVQHLELSGFDIDEAEQVMRKPPPSANHG
jgi:hypothetical protein